MLLEVVSERMVEWQKRLAYCMHDKSDLNQLKVLLNLVETDDSELCSTAGVDAEDINAYLDGFDTNWDQYNIEPMKYYLYMPDLDGDIGLSDGKNVVYVLRNEKFLSQ